jgi:hypothetical protein
LILPVNRLPWAVSSGADGRAGPEKREADAQHAGLDTISVEVSQQPRAVDGSNRSACSAASRPTTWRTAASGSA